MNKRFLISWLVASIVMFLASYLWHGVFLNDFARLSYPKAIFFFITSIVYLIIGFIVSKVYEIKHQSILQRKPRLKGVLTSAVCGLLIYLVTIVVGISFSKTMSPEYLLLDMGWQMFEQALGGLSIGFVHIFFTRRVPLQA